MEEKYLDTFLDSLKEQREDYKTLNSTLTTHLTSDGTWKGIAKGGFVIASLLISVVVGLATNNYLELKSKVDKKTEEYNKHVIDYEKTKSAYIARLKAEKVNND